MCVNLHEYSKESRWFSPVVSITNRWNEMKKVIILLSLLSGFAFSGSLWAQEGEIYYHVEVGKFADRQGNPYVEIQLGIEAASLLHQKNANGKWASEVGVAYEIKSKDTPQATAAFVKTFVLAGPELADTTGKLNYNLLDVRRAQLLPGAYTFTGFLIDRNDPDHTEHKFERDIFVDPVSVSSVTLSTIDLLRSMRPSQTETSLTKLGFEMNPIVSNGILIDRDSLVVYAEAYNSDKFLETFYFASVYLTRANSSTGLDTYKRTIKVPARGLDLITTSFDISRLPSETYYVNIDLYNRENQVVASTSERFYISNSRIQDKPLLATAEDWGWFGLSEEQLNYYIPTLAYISTQTEKDFAKVLTTFEEKKTFFYNFWSKRKENPADNPAKEWKVYQAKVEYANEKFKTVYRPGWKTDRGRVLLVYGVPNDLEQRMNENDRYPSEIWKYNRLGAQSNVTFIFYDPDGITGDWPLLHSDKIGENPNPRWKLDLVRRNTQDANMDHDDVDGTNTHPFRD